MKKDKVLVIAAHPDDEVLGVGGTIAKYVSQGAEVRLLIVTDGCISQYRDDARLKEIIDAKKRETRMAADVLGISEIIYGELPDMKLDMVEHITVNQVIESVIDEFQPNIVFTQFYGDVNVDHQCVNRSAIVACRPVPGQYVKEVYSYYVSSSTEWNIQNASTVFLPNTYVDINGEFAEKKYQAMECYKTELREYPHPRSIKALKIIDNANGLRVGLESAECFMAHRVIK